jgi:hypothetical protein
MNHIKHRVELPLVDIPQPRRLSNEKRQSQIDNFNPFNPLFKCYVRITVRINCGTTPGQQINIES